MQNRFCKKISRFFGCEECKRILDIRAHRKTKIGKILKQKEVSRKF